MSNDGTRGVFANRTLNLRSVQAIGYDMDYTLIDYKMELVEERVYHYSKMTLDRKGFPVSGLVFDPRLVVRGLIVDTSLGHTLKVDRFGHVRRAMHGTRELSPEEIYEAYENPASRDTVAHMVAEFERRRDWVVEALNGVAGIGCQNPRGAFYVFPNVAGACEQLGILDRYEALTSEEQATTSPSKMLQMFLLYRYGVATMDRASFGRIGAEGEHFLRLSIANSMEDIEEGVNRIGAAVQDPEGFRSFLQEERLW